ncbi:MAG: triacylglycerol lipase [Myxococcota bacterium]
MRDLQHVILVPGFFGFSELGDLPYFAHVAEVLTDNFTQRGWEVIVTKSSTSPTASIAQRAARLREVVVDVAHEGTIHLVGHSSGGLDAWWLAHEDRMEPWTRRLASVCGISVPHGGTPLASLFTGVQGHRVLQLLSLATVYILRFGRLPLGLAAKLVGVFARVDDVLRLNRTIADQLYQQLLSDLSRERTEQLSAFFSDVRQDQDLVAELRPEATEVRAIPDNPAVRYGCVVTQAARPGPRTAWRAGLDPYGQMTHGIYATLHTLTGRRPSGVVPPVYRDALFRAFARLPDGRSSDGVVPTLAQLRGTFVHGAGGDHLDVIGHFDDPEHEPPHFDWLASGTGFRRRDFERLWGRVTDFLLDEPLS